MGLAAQNWNPRELVLVSYRDLPRMHTGGDLFLEWVRNIELPWEEGHRRLQETARFLQYCNGARAVARELHALKANHGVVGAAHCM